MTPGEVAAIILAAATLISSVAGLIVAVRSAAKAEVTHDLVNGQSAALLALQGKASHAEGVQAGIEQERTRVTS